MPKFKLTSAEKSHAMAPKTFHIHSREERENVKPGSVVKLIFDEAERMWVKVEKRLPDFSYKGRLMNTPILIKTVKAGEMIEFGAEHICDIDNAVVCEKKAKRKR